MDCVFMWVQLEQVSEALLQGKGLLAKKRKRIKTVKELPEELGEVLVPTRHSAPSLWPQLQAVTLQFT